MDHPDRRQFGKLALGGALGTAAWLASAGRGSATVHTPQPGIKLCAQASAKPSDNDLLFLRQIGAEYVSVGSTPDLRTAEGFLQIKKRYADAGITVWNIGNTSVHNMPEVTLNLPGRDRKVEEYKQYLRNLAKAGIYYTTYAHMGNGIWSSGSATIRGASGREFDMASPNKQGVWDGVVYKEPLSHGREFSQGRDLGELHVLHQTGGSGGGRGGRAHRDSPGRSSGAGAGGRAALHLRELRRISPRHGDRQQPQRGDLHVLRHLAGGRQGTDRQRSRRDDPLFRRGENLEDPFSQRERAAAAFCRDLHGQRLLRHVQDHEGHARRQLRWHRDPGSLARAGGRRQCADRLRFRIHAGAVEPGQRRSRHSGHGEGNHERGNFAKKIDRNRRHRGFGISGERRGRHARAPL